MKWLGAFLVLAASWGIGNRLCAGKKRQALLLRDLLDCLERLRGELELRSAPLPELLQSIEEKSAGETARFLHRVRDSLERLGEEPFAKIWRQAAEDCLPSLAREETEELVRLGAVLGSLDLEAQLRALRFCVGFLRGRLEEQLRAYPVRRRLTLGLCICAAALAIILAL